MSINITFPFENSENGGYVKMSETTLIAIRSDLLHLILTQKGERYYLPDFGTNLRKYLFDQNDNLVMSDIKHEINDALQKYLPKLRVDDVDVKQNENDPRRADVRLFYTITDDVFQQRDELTVVI